MADSPRRWIIDTDDDGELAMSGPATFGPTRVIEAEPVLDLLERVVAVLELSDPSDGQAYREAVSLLRQCGRLK